MCFSGGGLRGGALNGLMGELVEAHIRFHVWTQTAAKDSPQAVAAEELIRYREVLSENSC